MKGMKSLLTASLLFIGLMSWAQIQNPSIDKCFFNFAGANKLTANPPEELPESSALPREMETEHGPVSVSVIGGYRVQYLNDKLAPFLNLKVEQSANGEYESDKKNMLEHLKYLINTSSNMKSDEIIELDFNGQKLYGFSRNSIEKGSTLGAFIMFPGDDIAVYFYFNNLKSEYRNFSSLEDYENQRDVFFDNYTKHLLNCE